MNVSNEHSGGERLQEIRFAHVQLYVDRLEDLEQYKRLEHDLNVYHSRVKNDQCDSIHLRKEDMLDLKLNLWKEVSGEDVVDDDSSFASQNRDIVRQLMVGFGFRVTQIHCGGNKMTQSMLLTTRDSNGAQFIITATTSEGNDSSTCASSTEDFLVSKDKVMRFFDKHNGRMGIGVLAFTVNNVESIRDRYQSMHPRLIESYQVIDSVARIKILETFAYYKHEHDDDNKIPDTGTILRFIECAQYEDFFLSAGFENVETVFDTVSHPVYSDHWVSNVFSRTELLQTLKDTIGFFPHVNFNAGIVAAGEAQIESTVIGNRSHNVVSDRELALKDQSQVYLPINNALTAIGHVHGFLHEIGQGVQHIASRVDDLVDFVEQANANRRVIGDGFTFLRIPRSYYGILSAQDLAEQLEQQHATEIFKCLRSQNLVGADGAVNLNTSTLELDRILTKNLDGATLSRYKGSRDSLLRCISSSRYKNLYSLLGDNVSEATYLSVVRNQILVDVQGEDLLYQIFTCNILQREHGHEAPFLEFIQRVCSEKGGCHRKIRPGCGGFGIRNFLTLFLSIEVTKAMQEASDANSKGDRDREKVANEMVECFTDQLDESNPILTQISEAMTEEGRCQEKINCVGNRDSDMRLWRAQLAKAVKRKESYNRKLMECSERYSARMKSIRENAAVSNP